MAWKDGFVIEYTASGDEPHKGPRSCKKCIHLKDKETCRIIGKLHPEVGYKSWRYCGRFSKDYSAQERKKAQKRKEKAERKRARAAGVAMPGSLAAKNPKLAERWDYERNAVNSDPKTISASSDQKFWWTCPKCGGSFKAEMKYMMQGYDPCPFCLNKRVLPGYNDLESIVPALAAEWHASKNLKLPSEALFKDEEWRAWWECSKCGHVWRQNIAERALAYARERCVADCPACGSVNSRADGDPPKKGGAQAKPAKNGGSETAKAGGKKAKKKKPTPNTFIRKGAGPLEKKKERPSGKRCKAEGCSRIADAGVFCKYHNGKA